MKTVERLQLQYVFGGIVQYRPGDRLPERTLPDYELVLMIEGNVSYRLFGEPTPLFPGDLVLARPGFKEIYRWDLLKQTRHAYFHFAIDSLPGDWPPEENWPVIHRTMPQSITALFRHIVERIGAHPEWPTVRPGVDVETLIEALMRMLLNPLEPQDSLDHHLPEAVAQAFNLMRLILDSEPQKSLKLDDLAQQAGVTEKHLCGLFRKSVGISPMKSFQLLKLQLAVNLLARSNLAVYEIANRCGFENPLYFTRCFSQTYGKPPTRIRKDMQEGRPPPLTPLPRGLNPRIFW